MLTTSERCQPSRQPLDGCWINWAVWLSQTEKLSWTHMYLPLISLTFQWFSLSLFFFRIVSWFYSLCLFSLTWSLLVFIKIWVKSVLWATCHLALLSCMTLSLSTVSSLGPINSSFVNFCVFSASIFNFFDLRCLLYVFECLFECI